MALYSPRDFICHILSYFTKGSKRCDFESLGENNDFSRDIMDLIESFDKEKKIKTIIELIDNISSSKQVHGAHYKGYLQLRSELFGLSDEDVFNLYSVMFTVDDQNDISFPAHAVMLDHFHEIVLDIARKTTVPVVLKNDDDLILFKKELYRTLARFVIRFCPVESMSVLNRYRKNTRVVLTMKEKGLTDKERKHLNCSLEITDKETVNRVKRAHYLYVYNSSDFVHGKMRIGNFYTFTTKDHSDTVSVQIVGHCYYDSNEEMVRQLGVEAFGYTNSTPEEFVDKARHNYTLFEIEKPVCLEIRELNQAIIKKSDFKTIKNPWGTSFYEDENVTSLFDDSNWETYLILDCCGVKVGNWYRYCPRCGKRIDVLKCKKGKTIPNTGLYELFDYATWSCSCGKGYERFSYFYCPICGKKREENDPSKTMTFDLEELKKTNPPQKGKKR